MPRKKNIDATKVCSSCNVAIDVHTDDIKACATCLATMSPSARVTAASLAKIEDHLRVARIISEHDHADNNLSDQFARLAKATEATMRENRTQTTALHGMVEKFLSKLESLLPDDKTTPRDPPNRPAGPSRN